MSFENHSQEQIIQGNEAETSSLAFPTADLESVLAKLDLPERYKHVGVKKQENDDMTVVELWQSPHSMEEQEPGDKIIRILIDKTQHVIQVYPEYAHTLTPHLTMSSLELETMGMSEVEKETFLRKKLSTTNSTHTEEVKLIRDPRIEASIQYINNLLQQGYELECDEENLGQRKFTLVVMEKQLEMLRSKQAFDHSSANGLTTRQQQELREKIETLEQQLSYLKKIDEEADALAEIDFEKRKNEVREPRNRRSIDQNPS